VKDVERDEFQRAVLEESLERPVVVDFWAPWCGPCRILGPILEKLAGEFGGDFLLAKVNTEANPELAEQFGIRSIPNVKIFRDGKVVDEFIGVISESRARAILRRHCPGPADEKFAQGMARLQQGQRERASLLFEETLQLDGSHHRAMLELGKLRAADGDFAGAAELWGRIPDTSPVADQAEALRQAVEFQSACSEAGGAAACAARAASEPEALEARYANGCCLAAAGDFRGALEEFLFVLARNRNFRDQAARKAMLTVFSLAGERSELTEEYRRRLARTLF
jgi:putative thioredoxin